MPFHLKTPTFIAIQFASLKNWINEAKKFEYFMARK